MQQSNVKIAVAAQHVADFIATAKETEKELIAQKQAEEQRGQFGFKGNFVNTVQSEPAIPDDNIDWNDDGDSEPDEEYQILN